MRLILHFGLHRSASSAVQRFLNLHHRALRQRRVLSLSQRIAKNEAFRTFTLLKGTHIANSGPQPNHVKIERHLETIAADFDAVIFSDENMPGLMIGDKGPAFSRAGRFAAMLRLLAQNHEVHAIAVLRRHADYLESIHRFAAWHGEPRDFPGFIARADLDSVSFCGLLDTVAGALGRDRLHVFSYDALRRDGGRALLRRILALAGTRLPGDRQLPLQNVSPDVRSIALMQTLHRHGVVLPKLTTLALNERLLLADADADSVAEMADAVASAGRRVFLPVTSGRAFRWSQQLLEAGVPLAGVSARSARALACEALVAAERTRQAVGLHAALKQQLTARFADDRAAVAGLYLPDWRQPAESGEAGEIPPDALLDLAK